MPRKSRRFGLGKEGEHGVLSILLRDLLSEMLGDVRGEVPAVKEEGASLLDVVGLAALGPLLEGDHGDAGEGGEFRGGNDAGLQEAADGAVHRPVLFIAWSCSRSSALLCF